MAKPLPLIKGDYTGEIVEILRSFSYIFAYFPYENFCLHPQQVESMQV